MTRYACSKPACPPRAAVEAAACPSCSHTECSCTCATCEAAATAERPPCSCVSCAGLRRRMEQDAATQRAATTLREIQAKRNPVTIQTSPTSEPNARVFNRRVFADGHHETDEELRERLLAMPINGIAVRIASGDQLDQIAELACSAPLLRARLTATCDVQRGIHVLGADAATATKCQCGAKMLAVVRA